MSFTPIYHRELETELHACFVLLLNLYRIPVKLTHLLDIMPIASSTAISTRHIHYMARRLGFDLKLADTVLYTLPNSAELYLAYCSKNGCSVLIVDESNSGWCFNPRISSRLLPLATEPNLFDQQGSLLFSVTMPRLGPAIPKKTRAPHWYLIQPVPKQVASYSAQQVQQELGRYPKEDAATTKATEFKADLRLVDWSLTALCNAHKLLSPDKPAWYGVYRQLNLRRGATIFLDHEQIPDAIDKLFDVASFFPKTGRDQQLHFMAQWLCDFLSIHPFFNGNRRIAAIAVNTLLHPYKFAINWQSIHSTEIYFALRCASYGHIKTLQRLLSQHSSDVIKRY